MAADCFDVEVSFDTNDLAEKYSGVTVSVVRMTPAMAAEFLKGNTHNRPVNRGHVKHLENVLAAGDMVMNGEAIIRSTDGTILNGQHRLIACVESGMAFDVMVVDGIDLEAFRTIDGGLKRRASDSLSMDGEVSSGKLASAMQCLVTFVDAGGKVRTGGGQGRRLTPQLACRVLKAHPEIRDSVAAMLRSKYYENQHGCLLHYLFSRVDRQAANEFARVLAEGDADIGRPFVRLREVIMHQRHDSHLRQPHAAKAIKAFNAEMSGARPKVLKLLQSEEFPVINGLDYDALLGSV